MSMMPFFPSLRPPITNRIWFDNSSTSEEAVVLKYERDHHDFLESMKNAANGLHPLGKVSTVPGIETDDEDGNDDSDDSDSHDEEDEDTNDRVIPGIPERSALGLYSPGEDMNINEDMPLVVDPGSQ